MRGAPLIVYFYPKADTPGCTTEAQDFTRLAPDFAHLDAQLLAVSRDAPEKLCKFRDKYVLTVRSEEHTSELQSLTGPSYAVFYMKKKKYCKRWNTPQDLDRHKPDEQKVEMKNL